MSAVTKGEQKDQVNHSNEIIITKLYHHLYLSGIYIVAAKRTAFGTFGGAFKNTSSGQLQTVAAKAAITAAGLQPEQIDSVNIGNVLPVSLLLFLLPSKVTVIKLFSNSKPALPSSPPSTVSSCRVT